MAQPITDYAAFFAGAKQAVQELEQLEEKQKQLEGKEKQLGNALKGKQRAVSDTIAQTVKQRSEEITKSYDAEIGKTQEQLKKIRAKREKAKNQGVKERIAEDTQSLVKENSELRGQIKTLFRANHVPKFCAGGLYYSLYFTKGLKEMGVMLLMLLIFFAAVPCGIYFALPERKTWQLILIYVADILIFGGIYVKLGNSTKLKYMEVLREGRSIRDRIRSNKKQMKVIARTIRKDKNEKLYNLEKFDDEIAQLDQDLAQTNRKKKEALNTFETVTKTIISDEIMSSSRAELDGMEAELQRISEELKSVRYAVKDKALFITDNYEVYTGKGFVTLERLTALEEIIQSGGARNISEAITVFKSRDRSKATE